jgi:4-hydroxybutyrate dehydrogenase
MSISTFAFPTTIRFGPGAIGQLPQELERLDIRRPLVVTDAGLARTPIFGRVMKLLGDAQPVAAFTQVAPNPTEQNVLDGVAAYRANLCDGVIGLGGGSPLDAAKAIRLKVTHRQPLALYDDLLDGGSRINEDVPPYIAIATTSGTGSEVSRSAVITLTATNRKTVIFSPHLIPSVAIADPELTLALPAHITAGTGMDAFTHNVEAYISLGYHPICDAVALGGARLAWENLPKAMVDPADLEARSNMMMASMMGAIAFQKGLGATHSLAHPLSSDFAMHHGTANAVMLPYVLRFNLEAARERLQQLADQFGYGDVVEAVSELNRRIGIPARLREFGVSETSLEALADKAIQDGCHQLNPRPCTRADLLNLYREAW